MIYKGVEYTVVSTAEPDIWEWRFQLGDKVKTGRTQTRLTALAARRVQAKIDTALRAASSAAAASNAAAPGASQATLLPVKLA